jgi:hypothetical protein
MNRSATFLAIALVSSIATPLVVRAAGPAAATSAASAPAKVATIAALDPAPALRATVGTTSDAAAAPCARKVRVVYQGFGPAPDACVTAASAR